MNTPITKLLRAGFKDQKLFMLFCNLSFAFIILVFTGCASTKEIKDDELIIKITEDVKFPRDLPSFNGKGLVSIKIIGDKVSTIQARQFKNFINVLDENSIREIEIRDVSFSGFRNIIDLKNSRRQIDKITITNCKFFGNQCIINGNNGHSAGVKQVLLKQNLIDGKGHPPLISSQKGFWLFCPVDLAHIDGNEIKNLVGFKSTLRAIHVGKAGSFAKSYIIENNKIRNITGGMKGEIQGIMTLGEGTAIIRNNVLENIYHLTPNSNDVEGIYSKSLHTEISHNRLFNSGDFEGSIVVKGDQIQDCSTKIYDNVIEFTQEFASKHNTAAIRIARSYNVIVENNIIKNSTFKDGAINLDSGYKSDRWLNNITIKNNTINFSGNRGIRLTGLKGDSILVTKNNLIFAPHPEIKVKNLIAIELKTTLHSPKADLSGINIEANVFDLKRDNSTAIYILSKEKNHKIRNLSVQNNEIIGNSEPVKILSRTQNKKYGKIETKRIGGNKNKVRKEQ